MWRTSSIWASFGSCRARCWRRRRRPSPPPACRWSHGPSRRSGAIRRPSVYNWLTFIIAVLAVYRVARMVAEEDGPAFVFKRLRAAHTDDKRSFAVGIRCFYCISFWVALPVALALVIVGGWDVLLWPIW